MKTNNSGITVSIVSHGHAEFLLNILDDISRLSSDISRVVITFNIPEVLKIKKNIYPFEIIIIVNKAIKGFGSNHNQAFKECNSKYFCVLNPDIRFNENPFKILIKGLNLNDRNVLIAPQVLNLDGKIEDSLRHFPTPWSLILRILKISSNTYTRNKNTNIIYPDWIAGMFLLFKSEYFHETKGFDDKYFLYFEDVDLCLRVWKNKKILLVDSSVNIIHDARRYSRKKLSYLLMHLKSAFRFFILFLLRFPKKEVN